MLRGLLKLTWIEIKIFLREPLGAIGTIGIPVLVFVSLITFTLMHITPGGPWDKEKAVAPQIVANLNAKYNLDKPAWQQYLLATG